ncbi:hypothetical protein ACOQFO_17015 [Ureibacillus sp. MALMAid1270]
MSQRASASPAHVADPFRLYSNVDNLAHLEKPNKHTHQLTQITTSI